MLCICTTTCMACGPASPELSSYQIIASHWFFFFFLIYVQSKTDRTSCQTQACIGHSAFAHRGGHVQNRIRRRQVRRGKIEHRLHLQLHLHE